MDGKFGTRQQQINQISGITIILRNRPRRFGEFDGEQGIVLLSLLPGLSRTPGQNIEQALSNFDIVVYRGTTLLMNFSWDRKDCFGFSYGH